MNTFTLIKADGTRQEVPFLLIDRVPCISNHVFGCEFGQHNDKGEWEREVPILAFEPTILTFEKVRMEVVKGPIRINSGYRSTAKQRVLFNRDMDEHGGRPSGEVAMPGSSPHELGAAMDLAIPAGWSAEKFAAAIRKASLELGFAEARTGWKMYRGTFVHFDMAPMMFAPVLKGGRSNPHPNDWRPGMVW